MLRLVTTADSDSSTRLTLCDNVVLRGTAVDAQRPNVAPLRAWANARGRHPQDTPRSRRQTVSHVLAARIQDVSRAARALHQQIAAAETRGGDLSLLKAQANRLSAQLVSLQAAAVGKHPLSASVHVHPHLRGESGTEPTPAA